MNLNYEEFKKLPEEHQKFYIEEMLPIINVINKNIIDISEVYILLEYFTPLIADKCLLGDSLRSYLDIKLRNILWNFGEKKLNINDYK